MRLARITVLRFERTLDGRAWNPAFRWRQRRAPLVLVEDADGATGVGEAWSPYAEVDPVLDALAHEVAPQLVSRTLDHPAQPLRERAGLAADRTRAAAWSGIDMALWDLHARRLGQPLWQALGGTRPQAPVYASGGLYRDGCTPDELGAEMGGYVARGFGAVKMKVGGLPLDEDAARVATVRQAIGPSTALWIDGVNQYNVDSARVLWDRVAPQAVSGLQSPLPADDVAGLRRLAAAGLPVIVSEAEHRPEAFARLLAEGAVHHLQFCLTLCGGFTGALALDAAAAAAGRRSTPQCFSTAIAQAASLHFAAARGNVVAAEFHGFHDHLAELYQPGVARIAPDGTAALGLAPGLGVALPRPGLYADGSVVSLHHSVSAA